jgi:hypothetical protein
MICKLIATDNQTGTTILRLVLGVVFFAHELEISGSGSKTVA